jgi:transposase
VILVPPGVRILLAARPVDFRKGMDGLAALSALPTSLRGIGQRPMVQQALQADPFQGDVFIFRPRRADRVKILVYDGTGLCLYSKRLEAGRFCWPSPAEGVVRLSAAQLATLLEGLPWHRLQPRAIPRPSTAW